MPTDSGGRVESLNLLRAAADAGVHLHVIVPGMVDADETAHRNALPNARFTAIPRDTRWSRHLMATPYVFASRPVPAGLAERVRPGRDDEPYTAVFAISFRVAHLGIVLAEALNLPLLVRPHNMESEYFREIGRAARFPRDMPYRLESSKLRRAERVVHRSRVVTLFADIAVEDADRRADLTSTPVLHVPPFLPQPVTTAGGTTPGPTDQPTVLFVGSLDNANNEDGVRWFADECWPRVRRMCPDVRLHVVGRRAPGRLRSDLAAAGSRVTVDAAETASHLARAAVFVNPVRQGSGVNIKVVDAMTAGVPVVSTSAGARGLPWRPGEHLLVADGAADFSEAVAVLLNDPASRVALGARGHRFVAEQLDGTGNIRRLMKFLARDAAAREGL